MAWLNSYTVADDLESFNKLNSAKKHARKIANEKGGEVVVQKWYMDSAMGTWRRGKDIIVKPTRQSNPSVLKKLRKGIRGHIKLVRGRLIIKT